MSALVAMLLAAFGPLLGEIVKALVEKWLKAAAKKLEGNQFGTPTLAAVAIIDQAIADAPLRAVGRRSLLRSMRHHAATAVGGFPLPHSAIAEFNDGAKLATRDK
jgi:hypothetical protein